MKKLILSSGAHDNPAKGTCLMEAVAWLWSEKHTDNPPCTCPVLAAFARRANDWSWSSNEARTEALIGYIPKLIGTVVAPDLMVKRAQIAAKWAKKWAAAANAAYAAYAAKAAYAAANAADAANAAYAANAHAYPAYAADAAKAAYAAAANAAYAAYSKAAQAAKAANAHYAAAAAYAKAAQAAKAANAHAADANAYADAYPAYAADAAAKAATKAATATRDEFYRDALKCLDEMIANGTPEPLQPEQVKRLEEIEVLG